MSTEIVSATEQARRRAALRDALAQVRMEGLEPHPLFFTYADRYSRGELSIDEAVADFIAQVARAQSQQDTHAS